MLTDDDIIRAVRRIRFTSKRLRNGRRAPSVNALAKAAGVDRLTIYHIAYGGRFRPETADKLRAALSQSPTC